MRTLQVAAAALVLGTFAGAAAADYVKITQEADFAARHMPAATPAEQGKGWKLLAMQEQALAAFASCALILSVSVTIVLVVVSSSENPSSCIFA